MTPDENIEKKYYSISEVAKQLNVAPSLIRFWESQFKAIKPRKNKNGIRQYTQDDIAQLNTIYFLVKEKGYTLQGASELLEKNKEKTADTVLLIQELQTIRSFLVDLRKRSLEKGLNLKNVNESEKLT